MLNIIIFLILRCFYKTVSNECILLTFYREKGNLIEYNVSNISCDYIL